MESYPYHPHHPTNNSNLPHMMEARHHLGSSHPPGDNSATDSRRELYSSWFVPAVQRLALRTRGGKPVQSFDWNIVNCPLLGRTRTPGCDVDFRRSLAQPFAIMVDRVRASLDRLAGDHCRSRFFEDRLHDRFLRPVAYEDVSILEKLLMA